MPDKKQIKEAFALFDVNGDGTISTEELCRILTRPVRGKPSPWTKEKCDALVKAYDANGDGRLDIDEFAKAWSRDGAFDNVELKKQQALIDAAAEFIEPMSSVAALYVRSYSARWADLGQAPKHATKSKHRDEALAWLARALQSVADKDPRYEARPHLWVLTCTRLWPDERNGSEPGFAQLKALAISRLSQLCDIYEAKYAQNQLGAVLGGLGAGVKCDEGPRQDTHAGLQATAPPPQLAGLPEEWRLSALNGVYLYMLRIAALAVDDLFWAKVGTGQPMPSGAKQVELALPGGGIVAASKVAPKSYMRMKAKQLTDHRQKPYPASAENCDVNRVAWVVEAGRMADACAMAAQALGPPVRVKNNYRPDFDARRQSSGYRCMLANYVLDTGKTWGQLAGPIERAHRQVRTTDEKVGDSDEEIARREELIGYAAHALKHDLATVPARMVVEVQYMTPDYKEMRGFTHAWYKLARADHAQGMLFDYLGGL